LRWNSSFLFFFFFSVRGIASTGILQEHSVLSENNRSHVDCASWRSQRLCLHYLRSSAACGYGSYKHTDAYVHSLDLGRKHRALAALSGVHRNLSSHYCNFTWRCLPAQISFLALGVKPTLHPCASKYRIWISRPPPPGDRERSMGFYSRLCPWPLSKFHSGRRGRPFKRHGNANSERGKDSGALGRQPSHRAAARAYSRLNNRPSRGSRVGTCSAIENATRRNRESPRQRRVPKSG